MHIVEKNYLGLELKSPARVSILREIVAGMMNNLHDATGISDPTEKESIVKGIWHSLVSPDVENYLLTETAQEVIRNIKVGEAFDVEILRMLPANELLFFNFLVGQDRVIKCTWSNDVLIVIDLTRHADNGGLHCESAVASLRPTHKGFDPILTGAIQCLIFLKLTEPEIIHLAAGKKLGTRKQGHYNATSYPVTIVDSTWNKYIVRTEGFSVSGHFRMQPHGKGNAELKLIWIKPFQKQGYARPPKSETISPMQQPVFTFYTPDGATVGTITCPADSQAYQQLVAAGYTSGQRNQVDTPGHFYEIESRSDNAG